MPIPPEDVRGIGIHVTRLSHHDHSQAIEAVPTRQFFPTRVAVQQEWKDCVNQTSDALPPSSPETRPSRSSNVYVIPSFSQIDKEVLTQLPEDVKQEIKRNLPLPPSRSAATETRLGKRLTWHRTRGEDPQTPSRAVVAKNEVHSPLSLTQQVQISLLRPS